MDAIAELTTAEAVAQAEEVTVIAIVNHNFSLTTISPVVNSAARSSILSMGGCSLNAVAPDNFIRKETALVAA